MTEWIMKDGHLVPAPGQLLETTPELAAEWAAIREAEDLENRRKEAACKRQRAGEAAERVKETADPEAYEAHRRGYTIAEAAEYMGCSRSTASRRFKKLGLEPRRIRPGPKPRQR